MRYRLIYLLLLLWWALSGVALAQPTVTVAVTDADAGEAGPNPGTFTFTRTGDTSAALRLRLTFEGTTNTSQFADWSNDPAIFGLGFGAWGLDIPAGESSLEWTITPKVDSLAEGDEVLTVVLGSSSDYEIGAEGSASLTIVDDAALVSVEATDTDISESGPNPGTFTFTRTGGDTSAPLTVEFRFEGDTNTSTFTDWTGDPAIGGLGGGEWGLEIPANQTSLVWTVTPIADSLDEGDEVLTVVLASSTAYTIGSPDRASVTIVDDAAVVSVEATDTDISEFGPNPGSFTFTRTGGDLSTALTLRIRFEGDTNTSTFTDWTDDPPSFGFGGGTWGLEIPANETSLIWEVTPTPDADEAEGDEVLTVVLVNSTAYTIGAPDRASLTIENFIDDMFGDGFEGAGSAAFIATQCAVAKLTAADPARYFDAGPTILDLDTELTWLRCAMTEWFDWVSDGCVAETGAVDVSPDLHQLNVGALGSNGGFDDWRVPSKAEIATVGAYATGCFVRD